MTRKARGLRLRFGVSSPTEVGFSLSLFPRKRFGVFPQEIWLFPKTELGFSLEIRVFSPFGFGFLGRSFRNIFGTLPEGLWKELQTAFPLFREGLGRFVEGFWKGVGTGFAGVPHGSRKASGMFLEELRKGLWMDLAWFYNGFLNV